MNYLLFYAVTHSKRRQIARKGNFFPLILSKMIEVALKSGVPNEPNHPKPVKRHF